MKNKNRVIALYLPQFHPTKENNEWWGEGFTEWFNVAKAKPRFIGHYQPHLPADLGFYDLRLSETREAQAVLAKKYGIDGFCYYHYWFNGKRILERPFEEVLKSGKPDFPFMLCWANENWTRGWVDDHHNILLKQEYSKEDDLAHIRYLLPIFKDDRYIKIDGKPVFCIYKSTLFPDIESTIKLWREEASKVGVELYICRFESYGITGQEYLKAGFDAAVEFQPHLAKENRYLGTKKIITQIINKLSRFFFSKNIKPLVLSYKKYVDYMCTIGMPTYKRFPCVTPMWDNSPRRQFYFFAFKGSTPFLYKKWLRHIFNIFKPFSKNENFIFINAWNEWGEGNHLEPCQKWGKQYLEKTKEVVEEFAK
jgi:hypothetical protein